MNICLHCKKEFKPKSGTKGKFCSRVCYWNNPDHHPAWNKGKNISGNSGRKHTLEYKEYMKVFMSGRKMPENSRENHYAWKDSKVGYRALHSWIERMIGKPNKCSQCGIIGYGRKMHWANKDHTYKRELKDWIRLCAKCHVAYDGRKARKLTTTNP